MRRKCVVSAPTIFMIKKEKCYVCSNKESENYGLMTYYDETCEDFEGRRQ